MNSSNEIKIMQLRDVLLTLSKENKFEDSDEDIIDIPTKIVNIGFGHDIVLSYDNLVNRDLFMKHVYKTMSQLMLEPDNKILIIQDKDVVVKTITGVEIKVVHHADTNLFKIKR